MSGRLSKDSLPPHGVAKNVLTIGSVTDLSGGWTPGSSPQPSIFSAYGPTDDGRIKPDVCANGDQVYSAAHDDPNDQSDGLYRVDSGTSMATASVTGSVGLLLELIARHRGTGYQPPASLLKGLVIHTADDILDTGPDYRSGWGLVNARSAAELVTANHTQNQEQNIRMVLLQNGVTLSIPVTATGGVPLKVTVCITEPAGSPVPVGLDPSNPMLVNDFSLQVTTAGAGPFDPFVLDHAIPVAPADTGVNSRDNVEQVLVANPVAGQPYIILVGPAQGETFVDGAGQPAPQEASVLISGIEPDPTLSFRILSIERTDLDEWTVAWTALVGSVYRVQASFDLTPESWVDITGDIVAQTSIVTRAVPSDPSSTAKVFWRIIKVL